MSTLSVAVVAVAFGLVNVPPLPPFPSEVRPRDSSIAPLNAAFFAVGDNAPNIGQIGVAVTVDGQPLAGVTTEAFGTNLVKASFGDVDEGDAVVVSLTHPGGDEVISWTAGPADATAPTLSDVVVIQHREAGGAYEVVLGMTAADDTQVGAVIGRFDGDVVGATVDGFLMTARLPVEIADAVGEHCIDVVAVDVANNESASGQACFTVEAGGGEGEGEGEDPPPGCATCSSSASGAPSLLALLTLGLALFARSRAAQRSDATESESARSRAAPMHSRNAQRSAATESSRSRAERRALTPPQSPPTSRGRRPHAAEAPPRDDDN